MFFHQYCYAGYIPWRMKAYNFINFIGMNKASKYHWFFKYRLYHIPFWIAYHILWWTINIGNFGDVIHNVFFSAYSYKFLFYVVFEALGVYFNLYYLMPKLLEKERFTEYAVFVLLTIVGVAVCMVPGYYFSAWVSGNSFEAMYYHKPQEYMFFFQMNTLPSSAAAMTLGMSVKLAKNWMQTKKHQQLLEKEKLETELKFLKSQFNPHFLFNSINSIFVLIHKNADMASEALAKFSELLRYQLYECNEAQISLRQELSYVKNFIELEQLRQEHNIHPNIVIDERNTANLRIAPFILTPFIENAFKHVSKRNDKANWIKMHLSVDEQQLHFEITNSISAHYHSSTELMPYKGIGLNNVQRRLNLLYPEKHTLIITKSNGNFTVQLQLQLQEKKIAAHTSELELSHV